MPTNKISAPQNVELILPDWQDEPRRRTDMRTYHQQRLAMVYEWASKYTNWKITKVPFRRGYTTSELLAFFKACFASKSKAAGDSVVVYFDGLGPGRDKKYRWTSEGQKRFRIDAYTVIQYLVDAPLDIMLWLDCRLPTRLQERWKKRNKDTPGNFEIMARGELDIDMEGKTLIGNFTRNVVIDLETVVKRKGQIRGKTLRAPLSIAELMKDNPNLCENPKRFFLLTPKKGGKMRIERFVFVPDHIRETGGFSLCLKRVQGDDMDDEDAMGDDAKHLFVQEDEDEGFSEKMQIDQGTDSASTATPNSLV